MTRFLALAVVLGLAGFAPPALALSNQECSVLFSAAKANGTLGGLSWNEFRAARCSGDAVEVTEPKEPVAPTRALSMRQCSARYQAAKASGTLGGLGWNEFRATRCGSDEEDEPTQASIDYGAEPPAPTTASPAGVRFPRAIARQFSDEKPGKARLLTCVAAYRINKQQGTLGGLKWIQKGGGYYSLCNARLKAATS